MPLTDDLYRDIILEHFKNPRNEGRVEQPDVTSEGANPFCGDELTLTLSLEADLIREIRTQAKGCSISQASASMMTEAVKGKTLSDAQALIKQFKAMMLENTPWETTPETEDLEALEGVKKYPVRIKCAVLSWNTLSEGIQAYRMGKHQATHVETEQQVPPPAATDPQGLSTSSPEEQIREALKRVIDPELNMNIVDLGLVYDVGADAEGHIKVAYTLTSPGCPLGPVIQGQISSALERIPWVNGVSLQLVWQPPWDPRTMASEEAKTELGLW